MQTPKLSQAIVAVLDVYQPSPEDRAALIDAVLELDQAVYSLHSGSFAKVVAQESDPTQSAIGGAETAGFAHELPDSEDPEDEDDHDSHVPG